jgi:surfactin synthase thioesterase subunit
MADDDWFVPLTEDSGARLLAFPHAGAGCAQLVALARKLRPELAVWGANLPGRQARLHEPPGTDLIGLVARLSDAAAELIADQPDRPYALFGYCGGALQAFLVARELRTRGLPTPRRLVVVSFEAPDIAALPKGIATQPTHRLWSMLAEQGGVPVELAEDPTLRGVAEASVRADFAMIAGYQHRADLPLPCPITVCRGTRDRTPRGALLGWRRQSTLPLDLRDLSGGHWLLDDACDELAKTITDVLRPEQTR